MRVSEEQQDENTSMGQYQLSKDPFSRRDSQNHLNSSTEHPYIQEEDQAEKEIEQAQKAIKKAVETLDKIEKQSDSIELENDHPYQNMGSLPKSRTESVGVQ